MRKQSVTASVMDAIHTKNSLIARVEVPFDSVTIEKPRCMRNRNTSRLLFIYGGLILLKKKACCFFGHRDTPDTIRPKLKQEIINLIVNHNVDTFHVGNQGNFDRLVYSVLEEVSKDYPNINYTIVLAYLPKENDEYLKNKNTLYPDGIESVPKRFAISYRNDWMINHSDFVICYITHITGGAYKYVEKANQKGKCVIKIFVL